MSEARPIQVGPPWKGLCFIDSLETPKHDICSINIDYAYGAKRPRQGWTRVATNLPAKYPVMFQHVFGAEQRYLVIVGSDLQVNGNPGDVYICVMNQYGQPAFGTSWVDSTWNISQLYGEPGVDGFVLCDSAPAMISTALGGTRTITIVTTRYQSYVFDPLEFPFQRIRPLNAAQVSYGGDAQLLAGGSYPYFATAPHGYIIERHQEAYWWAGWRSGDSVVLSQANPDTGTPSSLTSIVQNNTRETQTLGPWICAYSDPSDPAGVLSWHIFGVDGYEQITGLQSQNQSLLIFTQTATYLLQGNDDSSFTKQTLSRGIGCASHASIIDADGDSYWLAYDGAYALNQGDGIKCISDIIKPLWTGLYQTTVESSNFPMEEFGWPYVISRGDLQYARGCYHRPSRSLWWFVPVRRYLQNPVFSIVNTIQLVYSLDFQTWSIWLSPALKPNTLATYSSFLTSAQVIETPAGTKTYATTLNGEVWRYGGDSVDDIGIPGVGDGVYCSWLSGRVLLASDTWQLFRRLTFKMMERGLTDGVYPVAILRGERYPIDYNNVSNAKGESAVSFAPHQAASNGDNLQDVNLWSNGASGQVWGTAEWAAIDWITVTCDTGLGDYTPSARVGIVDQEGLCITQAYTCEVVAPISTRSRTSTVQVPI